MEKVKVRIGRIEVVRPEGVKLIFNHIREEEDSLTGKLRLVWDDESCILIYKENLLKYKKYLAKKHKGDILIQYKYIQIQPC